MVLQKIGTVQEIGGKIAVFGFADLERETTFGSSYGEGEKMRVQEIGIPLVLEEG